MMRRKGFSFTMCARLLGCSVHTIHKWRADDPKVHELLEKGLAECAEPQADVLLTNQEPALALKIMERLDPETWAPKPEEKIISVKLDLPSLLSDDALNVDWNLLDEAKKAGAFREVVEAEVISEAANERSDEEMADEAAEELSGETGSTEEDQQ